MNSAGKQSPTVILVGAGHAHLHVVAHAEALIQCGARVVLIDPGAFWYSGLATGMLGGSCEPVEDQVDPRALAEAHGVEFIQARVETVSPSLRQVRLAGGGELTYDYLSLSVGSRVNAASIAGAANDPSVWLVKPISNLWKLRVHLETSFHEGRIPRIVVVGGGPAGSEVAANLIALAARHGVTLPITVTTSSERLIPEAPLRASRSLQRNLTRRGVAIRTRTRIVLREGKFLVAEDGQRISADVVVLATGLEANRLVETMELPVRPGKGLLINGTLQSVANDRIFAGGDCAAMESFDLPKLGVFGVRQAACIHANLLASLKQKSLTRYTPQKRYLAILNLGDGTALATWGPFWWTGRSSMALKDWIDQRFLEGYRSHVANASARPKRAATLQSSGANDTSKNGTPLGTENRS